MAKITIQRIYDAAKDLATKSGQELTNFLTFTTTAFEEVVSALKNSLSYEDNFDCKVMTVELFDDLEQQVSAAAGLKVIKEIRVRQVISAAYGIETFHWWVASDGNARVKATFTGTPPGGTRIKVVLLVLYG